MAAISSSNALHASTIYNAFFPRRFNPTNKVFECNNSLQRNSSYDQIEPSYYKVYKTSMGTIPNNLQLKEITMAIFQ